MPPARRASDTSQRPRRKIPAARILVKRFRMPSRRDAVAPAVDRILELAAPAGLSDDERDNLAVAVAEALSNAAVHGHRLRPEAAVRVVVAVTPGACASVEVTDSGPGFDSGRVSDPTEPEGLMSTRGRGVFLMRRLVDRLEYNDSGNKVRLTMERRTRR